MDYLLGHNFGNRLFLAKYFPLLTSEKIADNAITNLKLAAYAIPVFSTFESYSDYVEA